MSLGKHSPTNQGTSRREREDSLAKNLREEYPEFSRVHGSSRLDTLKERFDVNSLNGAREKLKELK